MKKVSLITFILLLAVSHISAKRYHVSFSGYGDGSSWQQAFSDLQAALAVAVAGDEIWVTDGIYHPTTGTDRTASFVIPDGVALYGGFNGTESSLAQRNWQQNKSLLSGDLGQQNDSSDNSHTIVRFHQVGKNTILDGFFLVDGVANGFEEGAELTVAGAAIFNDAHNGVSSPTIRNCIFRNNYAREGGAIYNYAANGVCSPEITNCKFLNNKADFNGGAIFNDGNNGVCNPIVRNCNFESNWSVYGAGILNRGYNGECKPLIAGSIFVDNYSVVRGSAVYNLQEGSGQIAPIIAACRFENNGSTVGEAVEDTNNSNPTASSGGSIQLRSGY